MKQDHHAALVLATLALAQPVFGQNAVQLDEAEARDAAFAMLTATEGRFDCTFEVVSMRDIGTEPGLRYLFRITTEGNECREALIFITNRAAPDGNLIFRQVEDRVERNADVLPFIHDQVLIHEVNPGIGDKSTPERTDEDRTDIPPDSPST